MPEKTPKWAVIATWKRYSLYVLKGEAEEALKKWRDDLKGAGWTVSGSLADGYRASRLPDAWSKDTERAKHGLEPVATATARVVKLADHPVCYIGVQGRDVDSLREMEANGNPDFEWCSARAKVISDEWRQVEAL